MDVRVLRDDQVLQENPALAVWWHLARSFNLLARKCDRLLSQWSLTGPQLDVLLVIEKAGGRLSLSQVGERLLVTYGNITGVVDRLERDGLVVRQRCQEDRRVILACTTPEGHELCQEAKKALIVYITGLLDFMEPAEHRLLADQLERIHLHLKEGISS